MARLLVVGLVAAAAVADPQVGPAAQTLFGVAEGMLSDQPDLSNCIVNGLSTVTDAKTTFEDIKKALTERDLPDIADALDAMAATLRLIPETLTPCGATKDEAKSVAEALKEIDGFKDLLKKMETHVLTDFKDILAEVFAAKSSLNDKNYEEFGKHVGMGLHRLALGKFADGDDTMASAEGAKVPVNAFEIVLGVTEGILSDQPHLSTCIVNGLSTVTDAKTAFADIKKALSERDLPDIADALDAVAAILRIIPEVMPACDATKDDAKAVREAMKEIDGFKDLLKKMETHLAFDFKDIAAEVVAARSSLKEKSYEDFGKHVGMGLHRLAFGKFANGDVVV